MKERLCEVERLMLVVEGESGRAMGVYLCGNAEWALS